MLAGRLAEDSNVSILIIEAGAHNADLESTREPNIPCTSYMHVS